MNTMQQHPERREVEALLQDLQTAPTGTAQQLATEIDEHRFPLFFGGALVVASELGVLSVRSVRHQNDLSAYWFARWAAREALAFFDRMDKRLGQPYELHEDKVDASLRLHIARE